jgi:hypothetical protein
MPTLFTGALCGVHVENHTPEVVLRLGLRDQLAVYRHQLNQVLFADLRQVRHGGNSRHSGGTGLPRQGARVHRADQGDAPGMRAGVRAAALPALGLVRSLPAHYPRGGALVHESV